VPKKPVRFAAVGLNHNHIYMQVAALLRGGGELVAFYAPEDDLAARFQEKYPDVPRARELAEVLEAPNIDVITSASIPNERAPLGIHAMRHGKDFLVDKAGFTSLDQLNEARRVQRESGRFYTVFYAERVDDPVTVKAGELVAAGAIGRVIQTMGLGPHQLNLSPRPVWFFQPERNGGIISDVGTHQCDQFLYFTGSSKAEVVSAQIANIAHPDKPDFQDFGDVVLRGDAGTGYFRVDWFTPDGLGTWGDGRLVILGAEGYIELRKYCDIGGRAGEQHLFLVDQKRTTYIDCKDVYLPFGKQYVDDVLNRTENAMSQRHSFLASELALTAQAKAVRLNLAKGGRSVHA
jgi:predicted dehydrogenase